MARLGSAGSGAAGLGAAGTARRGRARLGAARQARLGMARSGRAWHGMARQARTIEGKDEMTTPPTTVATEGRRRPRLLEPAVLTLAIPGTPVGQGSMTLAASGSVRYPTSTVNHRNLAIDVLRSAWRPRSPMLVPVAVACRFVMPRPEDHYLPVNGQREVRELRGNAPEWHSGNRDLDKFCRLIGDALEIAGVVKNDGQIVLWRAEKSYGEHGLTVLEVHSLGPPNGR